MKQIWLAVPQGDNNVNGSLLDLAHHYGRNPPQDFSFEVLPYTERYDKPVEHNRNQIVTRLLQRPDFEWLLSLDSDTQVATPFPLLERLPEYAEKGLKIISGLYHILQGRYPLPTAYGHKEAQVNRRR